MQYNEIYPLLKNTIKWLQENYPHDTYFVINSNSATTGSYTHLSASDFAEISEEDGELPF